MNVDCDCNCLADHECHYPMDGENPLLHRQMMELAPGVFIPLSFD